MRKWTKIDWEVTFLVLFVSSAEKNFLYLQAFETQHIILTNGQVNARINMKAFGMQDSCPRRRHEEMYCGVHQLFWAGL